MGLYFTGDCHGKFGKFKDMLFGNTKDIKNCSMSCDVVAVAGDFGGIFDGVEDPKFAEAEKQLDALEKLPFTIVFVDGNHENFPRLNGFPVTQKFGGPVRRIRENIFWLCERGHIYDLLGNSVLCFGGACSFDRKKRIEGVSWWHQEIPTDDEYLRCMRELRGNDMKVDYILTHNAPLEALHRVGDMRALRFMEDPDFYGLSDPMPAFFQFIAERAFFRCWYFGHFHTDMGFHIRSAYGHRTYMSLFRKYVKAVEDESWESDAKIDVSPL